MNIIVDLAFIMTNKLKEILDLENQMCSNTTIERKKMYGEEFLHLESKFNISYPENLKKIASEIGFGSTFPIAADFYECLHDEIHYKTILTTNFIKTLLDEGIEAKEIKDLEFDLINKTFNHKKADEIYKIVNQEFECLEIAVNTFNDSYNCYIVLVLTGENKGNICTDYWNEITYKSHQHTFSCFKYIASLEDYIIMESKKYLDK